MSTFRSTNERPVWVIGHKNPDTDSICAAISYANLKNQTEEKTYIPKKAGKLNGESRYVLERFGVAEPETVEDVCTQIKDLDFRQNKGIDHHMSLKKAWGMMRDLDVVTMPVVNDAGFLEGIISNSDIAYSYMDVIDGGVLSRARTQYKNIIEILQGTVISGNEHAYFVKGQVMVAAGSQETIQTEIKEDDLVIVGNVNARIRMVLDRNPSCIIITASKKEDIDPEIILMAGAIQCILITTAFDSFTVARLINQSMPIGHFMTKDHIISFEIEDKVDDVQEQMSKVRHRDFPVVDDKQHYIGMISRRNLLDAKKKQVILVDHNEKSQAVDGIDQAEILEIIDHHRLGSLETMQPIYFRNQPLGCSNTIIYNMYVEKGVPISKEMAGIMLSAILSDTLMFRSPTCTAIDKAAAEELARIAEVDMEELAVAMFEAGSDFTGKSADQIIYTDFKIFYSGDTSFGVSQVSAPTKRQLDSIRDSLQDYLKTVQADKNIDMVFVMLTNILDETTELLCSGNNVDRIVNSAFRGILETVDGYTILPGVVSRKKQMVPPIIDAIQREDHS